MFVFVWVRMRSILLLCLLSFQANASFTVNVIDRNGLPVADAVLSFKAAQAAESLNSTPLAIMDQLGMQFDPHVLVVNKDQRVSFPNSDDTRHHVYSFSKPKVFELRLFKGTHSEPVVMETAGIVELGCNIHDQMLGFIYVDDTGTALKTDSSGQVIFLQDPPNQLLVWHPRINRVKGRLSEFPLNHDDENNTFTLTLDLDGALIEPADSGIKRKFKRKFTRPSS